MSRLTWLHKTRMRSRDGTFFDAYLCECGVGYFGLARAVRSGKTTSCGCWRKANLGKDRLGVSPANKLPEDERAVRYSWQYTKAGARHRDLKFTLTFEEVRELIFQNCHYCDEPPSKSVLVAKGSAPIKALTNGIDRKDNNVGYEAHNCLPCCTGCNYFKRDYGYEEFMDRIRKIASKDSKWNGRLDP